MKDYPDSFKYIDKHIYNEDIEIYDPIQKVHFKKKIGDYAINNLFLILFYYPADFSVVCPTELARVNELYEEFRKEETEILVVSRDNIYSHQHWIESETMLHDFKIHMISDRDGDILKGLDLFGDKNDDCRVTIIGSNYLKVVGLEVLPKNIGRNIDETLRKIKALRHIVYNPDVVCPENWDTHESTIKDPIGEEDSTKKRS